MSALTYATARILRVLPRAKVSRAFGKLADVEWNPRIGRAVVGIYSRMYDVEMADCAESSGWTSFDHFFTRGLRDGARPIASDPRTIVSCADGRLESMGRIDAGSTFQIKGRPYDCEELLGSREEAERYKGGAACVIYLSPRDYHRVHAPIDGVIREVRSLPGDYYPVNAIGVNHVKNVFSTNRRVAIAIDSPTLGRVTVVMVAAIVVGRITVSGIDARDVPIGTHVLEPAREIHRGDELGVFHLGSTAVVFLEERAIESWSAPEGAIRYGAPLARAKAIDATKPVEERRGKNGRGNGKKRAGRRDEA